MGGAKVFLGLVETLLEVTQRAPTHFDRAHDPGGMLDRVFESSPSFLASLLNWELITLDDPAALASRQLSDHAPIALGTSGRPQMPHAQRPINPAIFCTQNPRS